MAKKQQTTIRWSVSIFMYVDAASDFHCADCDAGPLTKVWVTTDGNETWLLCGCSFRVGME